jgi:hypothetical protein
MNPTGKMKIEMLENGIGEFVLSNKTTIQKAQVQTFTIYLFKGIYKL